MFEHISVNMSIQFAVLIFLLLRITGNALINLGLIEQDKDILAECMVKIIENYPGIIRKISIFSSRNDSLLLTAIHHRLQVPTIINSMEYRRKRGLDTRVYNDIVIIHHENLDVQKMLEGVLWHGKTKFLVIYGALEKMEEDFQNFWNKQIVNVFALTDESRGIFLYSFLPFRVSDCGDTKPFLLDEWVDDSFLNGGFSMIYEDIRIKNLNGCPLNVSFVNVKPMALFPDGCQCNNLTDIDGIEARYLKFLAQKLNFSATYATAKDGGNWGSINPVRGVIGEVYTGISTFGFGLLAPVMERHEHLDFSRHYGEKECITFAVPIGSGKELLSWLKNIKSDLTSNEWILILVSWISTAIVYYLGAKVTLTVAFIYTLTSFFGHTVKLPKKKALKFLMLFWIIFAFTVTHIYEASMGSYITVPLPPPEIETLAELADSNLELVGHLNMLAILKISRAKPGVEDIANKFQVSNIEVYEAVKRMMDYRDMAYIRHMSTIKYFILEIPKAKENIRAVEECVYDFYPAIAMQKYSPFTRRVNEIIARIFESGIGIYWRAHILPEIYDTKPEVKAFKLNESLGIFTILIIGLMVATFVFLLEITTSAWKRKIFIKFLKRTRRKNH